MFQRKTRIKLEESKQKKKYNFLHSKDVPPLQHSTIGTKKIPKSDIMILFLLQHKLSKRIITRMTLNKIKKDLLHDSSTSFFHLIPDHHISDNESVLEKRMRIKCSRDDYYAMMISKLIYSNYFQSQKYDLIPSLLQIYFKWRYSKVRNMTKSTFLKVKKIFIKSET